MSNFIEIGGGSRKFCKKLVYLTRNDPYDINLTVDLLLSTLSLIRPNDWNCVSYISANGTPYYILTSDFIEI